MLILGRTFRKFRQETPDVHPTCDLCGQELDRLQQQYVATIDIRPTTGATGTDEESADRDHLLEMHEMLESACEEDFAVEDFEPQEFLLCHECCRRFQEDPLPRETALHVGFSKN